MTERRDFDQRDAASAGPDSRGIGDNRPPLARSIAAEEGDFALVTTAFLEDEYGKHGTIVQGLLDEATALMRDSNGDLKRITDDDTKGKVASLIKRMRDEAKALVGLHDKEKTPYLRGGQAVDQWFYGFVDRLARRDKNNRPGAADILNDLLTEYDTRKLAEEQERRRLIAQEEARVAREAQEAAAKAAREAEEARLAAERARKPESKEERAGEARAAEQAASQAAVEAQVTTQKAEEAHVATLAKPADLMRTRGDDGTLSTMAEEKYAEIEDRTKLDMAALWPYLPLPAIQTALNQWARLTDYRTPMTGAAIGRRNKSRVR